MIIRKTIDNKQILFEQFLLRFQICPFLTKHSFFIARLQRWVIFRWTDNFLRLRIIDVVEPWRVCIFVFLRFPGESLWFFDNYQACCTFPNFRDAWQLYLNFLRSCISGREFPLMSLFLKWWILVRWVNIAWSGSVNLVGLNLVFVMFRAPGILWHITFKLHVHLFFKEWRILWFVFSHFVFNQTRF